MKIQTILCPIDFSEFNHEANEYASMLAHSTGASISYLHVYRPDPYTNPPAFFDAEEVEKEQLDLLSQFISPTKNNVAFSYSVRFGTTAKQILRFTTQNDIDLIVMSTHGRTGFRRLMMGSVTEAIVRNAGCPVIAIKSKSKHEVPKPYSKSVR